MKIFGLCLVKNEADCIEEVLQKASVWCDKIFVFDTGSEDDSWEKVLNLAKSNNSIVPFKKEIRKFNNFLRGEIFNHYRDIASDGDWWCRLDADEIYIDDPRTFLKKISPLHHVIWSASCQYYFTEKDLEQYNTDPEEYENIELEKRIRHYLCNHSEERFFKYRKDLIWPKGSWPRHLGIVSPHRIKLKHLQYRSPQQIQKRLVTRQKAIQDGHKNFAKYSLEKNWEEKVVDSKDYHFDTLTGNYIIDETILPRHLERWDKRFLKHILHFLKIFP
ncbi:glycosyltransferase family 2 protein [Pedobacter montanisoli]|uniref:Glycosyltransferase family 2 protein n=1 Tax=Pedobacter montanisoli TaxID=2923277 RepID=A0ABS9ZVV4_9SPHI|nr:glycosyltransferase family 2 protein [Pedobacter montanisoli]MCJ0742440.1 glycosyltransferase family 2 protein [Pedobacter montanisoli]